MKPKTIAILFTAVFLLLCGGLILQSGVVSFCGKCIAQSADEPTPEAESMPDAAPESAETGAAMERSDEFAEKLTRLSAVSQKEQTAVLGELGETIERTDDPTRYKFRVELTSKGAAVRTVSMSEFDNRFQEKHGPLELLFEPRNTRPLLSLANTSLRVAPAAGDFAEWAFPLNALNWTLGEHDENHAVYEAVLGLVQDKEMAEPMLKVRKMYTIAPGSYDLDVRLEVKNLTDRDLKAQFDFQGPVGLSREDIQRDGRKIMAAYQPEGGEMTLVDMDTQKLRKMIDKNDIEELEMTPKQGAMPLVWAGNVNKYFAAIVRPTENAEDVVFRQAGLRELPQDAISRETEAVLFSFGTKPITLAAAGRENSSINLGLSVFLGPKDKDLFENNDAYRKYGYYHTIAFRTCCCPESIIAPVAFAIMWLMKTFYTLMGPFGNYGVVIFILVFLIRLAMHPLTKHQQVSMMKMQKLGPRLKEVQEKYKGSNPMEIQKKISEVYAEAGMTQLTPVLSMMLPMMIQLPIWMGLWTSVYTSVDLRGAGFLPFWITDLSAPDALIRFPKYGFTIPLIHLRIESLNILPLVMGVVMYLQQKMMSKAQTATTQVSPEMAQQQKIMAVMFPLMFPLFLYNGPSGVNLYIMSSISAGLIEQMVIRKHLREQSEQNQRNYVPTTQKAGGKVKKKKPKPLFRENR